MERLAGAARQTLRHVPKAAQSSLESQKIFDVSSAGDELFSAPTTDQMAALVAQRNFHGARRVWEHMHSLNVSMKPDLIYAEAALFQLQQTKHNNTALQESWENVFHDWLALIPPKHEIPYWPRPFSAILDQLRRSSPPRENIHALKRFAIFVAAKGYLRDVWQPFAATFFHLKKPDHAVAFLKQLEDVAVQYENGSPHTRGNPRERYRALFIETCVRAGWLQEAVNLLHQSANLRLPKKTGHLVSQEVGRDGDKQGVEVVRRILRDREAKYAMERLGESQKQVPTCPDDGLHDAYNTDYYCKR